jgi:hypothetical protein
MNKLSPLILIAVIGLCSAGAMAQMDVDQADSLDFEDFHKDKKEAIKVWKDDNGDTQVGTKSEVIKTYDQTPAATVPAAAVAPRSTPVAAATKKDGTTAAGKTGQRYEIRARYTLTSSAKTPYSAFYVVEPLYREAAQLCAKGWKKLTERSEPVEQDFYLYYQLECL